MWPSITSLGEEKKGGDREVSAIAFWRWALLSELALQED